MVVFRIAHAASRDQPLTILAIGSWTSCAFDTPMVHMYPSNIMAIVIVFYCCAAAALTSALLCILSFECQFYGETRRRILAASGPSKARVVP